MYTANIIGDVVDREASRRILTVEFTDGLSTFSRDFSFRVLEEPETVKRTIVAALDELNYVPPAISDLEVPAQDIKSTESTNEERTFLDWLADYRLLETAQRLLAMGIITGNEPDIVSLKNRVTNGFRMAYLSRIL